MSSGIGSGRHGQVVAERRLPTGMQGGKQVVRSGARRRAVNRNIGWEPVEGVMGDKVNSCGKAMLGATM